MLKPRLCVFVISGVVHDRRVCGLHDSLSHRSYVPTLWRRLLGNGRESRVEQVKRCRFELGRPAVLRNGAKSRSPEVRRRADPERVPGDCRFVGPADGALAAAIPRIDGDARNKPHRDNRWPHQREGRIRHACFRYRGARLQGLALRPEPRYVDDERKREHRWLVQSDPGRHQYDADERSHDHGIGYRR